MRLDRITKALRAYEPHKRQARVRAAVALVLREAAGVVEILLVERAERRGDRWSGHLAFPGGVRAPGDADLVKTALREVREEAGFDLGQSGTWLGELSDVVTLAHGALRPMIVTPFVFALSSEPEILLGAELSSSFWLPFAEFAEARSALGRWRRRAGWIAARAGHPLGPTTLWGLSLMMADELVDVSSES